MDSVEQIRATFQTGFGLETRGEIDEALKLYEAVREAPGTPANLRANASYRIGCLLEKRGQRELALDAIGQCAKGATDPRLRAIAQFHFASLLANSGRYAEALQWVKRLQSDSETDEPTELTLKMKELHCRARLGELGTVQLPPDGTVLQSSEALAWFEAADSLEVCGFADLSWTLFERLPRMRGVDEELAIYAQARLACLLIGQRSEFGAFRKIFRLVDTGNLDEAFEACSGIPLDSTESRIVFFGALLRTAFALERAGDADRAANLYQQVLDAPHPESDEANWTTVHALMHLASTYLATNPGKAGELAPRLLASPETVVRLKGMECLVQATGARPEAADIETLLPEVGAEIDAPVANAWLDAAAAMERAGHLEVCRLLYERLLHVHGVPGVLRTNTHFRLGLVLDALTRWDLARVQYQAALDAPDAFPPAQAQAAFSLAKIILIEDDFDGAAHRLRTLKSDPNLHSSQQRECQYLLGSALLRSGDARAAIEELERCRATAEYQVKADLLLAEAFESLRDFAGARLCFERIIHSADTEPLTKAAALSRLQHIGR